MSENSKLSAENLAGRMSLASESAAPESNPLSDTEAQMRRALGLFGQGMRNSHDNERGDQGGRPQDRFGHGGHGGGHQGLQRRRFVQDGEVPVTVVRRDPGADSAAAAVPQSSRLQRTEAALAAETANRERAERALTDAQNQIRDLKTKIGHAELARAEAVDIARREREAAASRAETSSAWEEEIKSINEQIEAADDARRAAQAALAEERTARKTAERALRDALERAEAMTHAHERDRTAAARQTVVPEPAIQLAPVASNVRHIDEHVPARRGRPPGSKSAIKTVMQPAVEAEPVKWWLLPSPKAKAKAR